MKSFLLVTLASVIFPSLTQSVVAQKQIKFIDNIEIAHPSLSSGVLLASVSETPKPQKFTTSKKTELFSLSIENFNKLQLKYALVLNSNLEAIGNVTLFKFIDEWYGVKYRYGGTSQKGIDCSSFSGRLYYEVFGNMLPRTAREQYHETTRISKENLTEGDLVFFNTTGGVSHVGVYLINGYFVHSARSGGVMVSHLDEPYFTKRYLGAGRLVASGAAGQVKVL